jgi:hypothetical protein
MASQHSNCTGTALYLYTATNYTNPLCAGVGKVQLDRCPETGTCTHSTIPPSEHKYFVAQFSGTALNYTTTSLLSLLQALNLANSTVKGNRRVQSVTILSDAPHVVDIVNHHFNCTHFGENEREVMRLIAKAHKFLERKYVDGHFTCSRKDSRGARRARVMARRGCKGQRGEQLLLRDYERPTACEAALIRLINGGGFMRMKMLWIVPRIQVIHPDLLAT